ncbi:MULTISPECIES: TetR/AcrR family transcriptional regulator [unclassified Corynebacterium]|uniref:TetR/AcrR family transcriptional regulator n=1 Tax=unclassified Corynebacterium TaxID=2624378 RepID=UPI0021AA674F|nr:MULTISPECIES: TetR/AcrR family transcriptional regulator [unclassified Corynebacterium]MCT1452700.1 TetR family transcriptional regulator [Corynebacterium sp. p3-SID1145]MCT1461602.1 TetR family transcriptional regulator [Corynebacterium sp. p3-SID1140]MDN8594599.1 TetR/AcrR family transcriptional regulator [Corynebacterium sp. P4_F2]WKK55558.1 TetR/AcrR family transcriptional regulator [Corynebacterium sp. P4-C1]WKK62968.1 TetR/AcrR family transcriptional regulator [Corynebacterium sp. P8-
MTESPQPGPLSGGEPADKADSATLDRAVDIALTHFAREGYAATKLETIAREAGMSKRMLHYHFGDKRGLYHRALTRAAWSFSPLQEFLDRSYAVPVEGIRRFVDVLYNRMIQHPDSIRLLLRENLDPVLTPEEINAARNDSEVLLQIERLLLMGQDAGAFRPGVSATDVVVLIASLTFFRVGNHAAVEEFGSINLLSPANTEGMRRLTIDAVLTFLTSNIPNSGYESYLSYPTPQITEQQDEEESSEGDYIADTLIDDIYDPNYTATPSGE